MPDTPRFPGRNALLSALLVGGILSVAPLAAQQTSVPDSAAIARADSLRRTLVQPPADKGLTAADLVRAPFRGLGLAGATLAGGALFLYDRVGTPLLTARARLSSVGLRTDVGYLGSRSGLALRARWTAGPLFVEGGGSYRGYWLARGGLAVGGPGLGLEVSAGRRSMPQIHFWGVGPRSSASGRSDFAATVTEVGGTAHARLAPRVVLEGGGAWEQDRIGRGTDGGAPDLQDVFVDRLPFGALGTERFARAEAALDVDGSGLTRAQQVKGARIRVAWSGFHGLRDQDPSFQLGSSDVRLYLPIDNRHSLALRGLAADAFGVSGGVPLYHLFALGDDEGLRGQKGERLRDRALLAAMAEWRYRVWWGPTWPTWRIDGFAFVDHGSVGPSLGAIHAADFTTTPGIGLRLLHEGAAIAEAYLAFGGDKPRVGARMGATF